MITFSSVSKKYEDGTEAIKSLNLSINEGEFFVIIGPSGCGKTTTMKMINRLITPSKGEIKVKDKEISSYNINELRWNIGYVLQQIALFPHLTISENIAIVPEMKKWPHEKIKKRTDELLHMVGLEPHIYRNRKPHELSGGQQQRVGVVRALAGDPDIILMDEPFSALDPISREQLQRDISKLHKEINKTIVFVTHDIDEALALGDRICLMNKGEVVQVDTPQNFILKPKNQFVKEFIGDRKSSWLAKVEEVYKPFEVDEEVSQFEAEKMVRIQGNQTLQDALHQFANSNVDILLVMNEDKQIGTLSYKDIVMYLAKKDQDKGALV